MNESTARQTDRQAGGGGAGAGGTLLQRVVLIDFVAVSSVGKQTTRAWATNLVEHKVETVEHSKSKSKSNPGLCKTVAKHSRPNLVGPNFGLASGPPLAPVPPGTFPSRYLSVLCGAVVLWCCWCYCNCHWFFFFILSLILFFLWLIFKCCGPMDFHFHSLAIN